MKPKTVEEEQRLETAFDRYDKAMRKMIVLCISGGIAFGIAFFALLKFLGIL